MFIDVHCHLEMCSDVDGCIKRAKDKDILIVTQGVNSKSNRTALELGKNENVRVALGLYPIDCLSMNEKEIKDELKFIKKNRDKIVAIGEVGLDFKEDLKQHEKQKNVFSDLIKLANELNIPIIVHSRKAEADCIELLEKFEAKKVVMHCFSGNFKLVDRIIKNGWTLTIPTNVKNSEHFQKIICMCQIEQLLCETDSPYLHPDKLRDNEPSNVIVSYQKIAEIKGLGLKDVEKNIESNFKRLFENIKA